MQLQPLSIQPNLQVRIMQLLRDEGWCDITLQPHNQGMRVEAHHEGDPLGKRVRFGLGPADLDAIGRAYK
jgi:hypothetical protein